MLILTQQPKPSYMSSAWLYVPHNDGCNSRRMASLFIVGEPIQSLSWSRILPFTVYPSLFATEAAVEEATETITIKELQWRHQHDSKSAKTVDHKFSTVVHNYYRYKWLSIMLQLWRQSADSTYNVLWVWTIHHTRTPSSYTYSSFVFGALTMTWVQVARERERERERWRGKLQTY